MKKSLVSLLAVVFLTPSVSFASTLSQSQIDAIIGLLQAFNVSQSIITAVQNELEPQSVAVPATTPTISNTSTSATNTAPAVSNAGVVSNPTPAPSVPSLQFIQTPTVSATTDGKYQLNWETNVPASMDFRQAMGIQSIKGEISLFPKGDVGASAYRYTVQATTTGSFVFDNSYRGFTLDFKTTDGQEVVWDGSTYPK